MVPVAGHTVPVKGHHGVDVEARHVPQDDVADQLLPPPDCGVIFKLGMSHHYDVGHRNAQDPAGLVQLLLPSVALFSPWAHDQQKYFTPSPGQPQDGGPEEHDLVIRVTGYEEYSGRRLEMFLNWMRGQLGHN